MSQSYEIDMCHGPLFGKIIRFSIPLMLSGILQLLFNAADIIVVGRFVGSTALAAVGSTSSLINLLINLFIGFSVGANVLVARFHGAGRDDEVNETVHTAITLSMISGIFLLIFGVTVTRTLLIWMGSPDDVLDQSSLYLKIYFLAMPATLLYNFGSSILRAVGDTKRPLFYLVTAGIINVCFNLFFVIVCHLGVAGVGLATVIAEYISAALIIRCLMRSQGCCHLDLHQLGIVKGKLRQIMQIGLPAGMQSVMYGLSNVIIQSGINSLGTNTVAAWAAYSKLDSVFWMMINAFGISVTTFVGQNYGAGKMDRVHRGVRTCMVMTILASLGMSFLIYRYGVYGYELFTTDQDVISIGIAMMRYLAPLYVEYVAIEILSGSLRGVGDCWCPMIISLLGVCVLRVGWILIAVPLKRDIYTIMFSYPLTWVTTTVLFVIYYLFFGKLKRERAGIRKAAGA